MKTIIKTINDSWIYSERLTEKLNKIFNGLINKSYIWNIEGYKDEDLELYIENKIVNKKDINKIELESYPILLLFKNGSVISFSSSDYACISKEIIYE